MTARKPGPVEVPNNVRLSCLDSSLGRVALLRCRRAEVRAPSVTCLSRRSPRG
jgi:hypothetical protein